MPTQGQTASEKGLFHFVEYRSYELGDVLMPYRYSEYLKSPCFWGLVGIVMLGLAVLIKFLFPSCFMVMGGISGAGLPPPIQYPCGKWMLVSVLFLVVASSFIFVGLLFCVPKQITVMWRDAPFGVYNFLAWILYGGVVSYGYFIPCEGGSLVGVSIPFVMFVLVGLSLSKLIIVVSKTLDKRTRITMKSVLMAFALLFVVVSGSGNFPQGLQGMIASRGNSNTMYCERFAASFTFLRYVMCVIFSVSLLLSGRPKTTEEH